MDLPEKVFNGLDLLEDLDLTTNKLKKLPKNIFSGLMSLKRLKIAENSITELEPGNIQQIKQRH